MRLLNRGLSFVPSHNKVLKSTILNSLEKFIRNLKLKSYFYNNKQQTPKPAKLPFLPPSTWTPKPEQLRTDITALEKQLRELTQNILTETDGESIEDPDCPSNLPQEEMNALQNLKNDNSIIIKPADKGGATVILDKNNYILEAQRQLDDRKYYEKIEGPIYQKTIPLYNRELAILKNKNHINVKQLGILAAKDKLKPRYFYLLPKIHKAPDTWTIKNKLPPGRPIVSDSNGESKTITKFIDHHLKPLANKHPAFIKNSYDFINKIHGQSIPEDALLVTGDITSLYTNMKKEIVLETVKKQMAKFPDPERPDCEILNLLGLSLANNDFTFNHNFFLQVFGMAMGKNYAPHAADIYLIDFDQSATHLFSPQPKFYYRYIDDTFFIWLGSIQELLHYQDFLNSLIPDIKINLEYSTTHVNFLDVTIYKHRTPLGYHILLHKTYFKPTDTHQLLHFDSHHPKHTFHGILKSQFLRFKRLSSTPQQFHETCSILMSQLKHRGYPPRLMRKIKQEIWDRDPWPEPGDGKPKNLHGTIVLSLPFNNISKIILDKWIEISKGHPQMAKTRFVKAYTVHKSLHAHLVNGLLE